MNLAAETKIESAEYRKALKTGSGIMTNPYGAAERRDGLGIKGEREFKSFLSSPPGGTADDPANGS